MKHRCVILELKGQAIGVVLQSCDFNRTLKSLTWRQRELPAIRVLAI